MIGRRICRRPPNRTRDEGLRHSVVALGVGFVLLGQHGEVHFEPRPGRPLRLGLSIGTAIFPQDGETYESLLATADRRMYQDKAQRKSRVAATNARV